MICQQKMLLNYLTGGLTALELRENLERLMENKLSENNKGVAGQLHLNTKPTKPGATQAVGKSPMENYIGYHNKAYPSDFANTKPMTPAEAVMGKVIDEYGNQEHATSRIREQDNQEKISEEVKAKAFYELAKPKLPQQEVKAKYQSPNLQRLSADPTLFVNVKPTKKMSATRSWQIIKQSMSPEEREEWYKDHPKDRPIKMSPVKLDPGLTQMLGDDEDWLI
jgi:hypothetical protein